MTTQENKPECKCGRSPDGNCCGWHKLTNEQYQVKLKEHNEQSGKQLLNERI